MTVDQFPSRNSTHDDVEEVVVHGAGEFILEDLPPPGHDPFVAEETSADGRREESAENEEVIEPEDTPFEAEFVGEVGVETFLEEGPIAAPEEPETANRAEVREDVPLADKHIESSREVAETASVLDLPAGYVLRGSGIHAIDDDGKELWLCGWMNVRARCSDASQETWGSVIDIRNPAGQMKTRIFTAGDLAGNMRDVAKQLRNLGLQINPDKEATAALHRLLITWQPERQMRQVFRCGWTEGDDRGFVLGGGRVIGSDALVAQGHAVSALANEMRSSGTLDSWRREVGRLCSGNPLALFAISIAFSGPLLQLIGRELSGGVHLGGSSSSGKSTLADVATSVWGSPNFKQTWRATANGIEALALATNSTLLVLDELGSANPKQVGDVIYMLGNGTGKLRMNADAGLASTATWQVPFLSTGELGLVEKLAEAGKEIMDGQIVRLFEVNADGRAFGAFDDLHGEARPSVFADRLKAASAENFGTAGIAFVEALVSDLGKSITMTRDFAAKFRAAVTLKPSEAADGQVQRVLGRISWVAAAGELATQFGITGWSPTEVSDAMVEIFGDWLGNRHSDRQEVSGVYLMKIRTYVTKNWANLVDLAGLKSVPAKGPGWRDSRYVYLPRETWSTIFSADEIEASVGALDKAGILVPGEGRNKAKRLNKLEGRKRAYTLKLEIVLENDGDGPVPSTGVTGLAA